MLIKLTPDMTESEKLAAQNSNNQYLLNRWYTVELDDITWTCKKSDDGTAECYCSIPYEVSIATATGNLYQGSINIGKKLPLDFIENPYKSITLEPAAANHWLSRLNFSNNYIRLFNLYSYTSIKATGTVHIGLKGRWK